jgi:biopolymer transport protein ExbD
MKIRRKPPSLGQPAVAMADIAFNLVLFFIMMAKTQDDSQLAWRPAGGSKLETAGNSRISVVVDRNNKLYFNGQPIGESSLKDAIEQELGDSPPGKRIVLLKIDKEATAIRFEPIIEAVSQAGGECFHILERRDSVD